MQSKEDFLFVIHDKMDHYKNNFSVVSNEEQNGVWPRVVANHID